MRSLKVQLLVGVLLAVTTTVHAHIALVYPPARTYAIDFLDNARTVPQCGMAKGLYTRVHHQKIIDALVHNIVN